MSFSRNWSGGFLLAEQASENLEGIPGYNWHIIRLVQFLLKSVNDLLADRESVKERFGQFRQQAQGAVDIAETAAAPGGIGRIPWLSATGSQTHPQGHRPLV